jgi:hypothetical protein
MQTTAPILLNFDFVGSKMIEQFLILVPSLLSDFRIQALLAGF